MYENDSAPYTRAIGGMFVGIVFSMLIYGLTLAQTLYYAWNYADDTVALKCLVGALCIMDTLRAALVIDNEWWYLIENHSNAVSLEELQGNATISHCVISIIVIFVVQCFFIYNIWKLMTEKRGQLLLSLIAFALAVISAAAGFAFIHEASTGKAVSTILSDVIPSGSVQAVAALLTDFYITVSLCCILTATKSNMPERAVLSKLVIYLANRGLLIVIVQLVLLVTYVPEWHNVHMIVDMFHLHEPSSTVYVNSLLAVLNVRQHLREKRQVVSVVWDRPPPGLNMDTVRSAKPRDGHDNAASPSSGFFSLLGRKSHQNSLVLDILITREVFVDDQLNSFDSVPATASAIQDAHTFEDLPHEKPLGRSNTL